MPFNRPSLSTLIERMTTDMEGRMPGAVVRQARSNLYALARVDAGAIHGLYGYIQWLSQQLPDTAEVEYLERWAAIFGVARTPAGFAENDLQLSGNSGAVVPAGTRLQRADGQAYLTDLAVTLVAGVATVKVVAEQPGAAASLATGEVLSFVSPVAGVESTATVLASGQLSGADAQSDESLRAALIERIQLPPHGGAKHDYITWAKQIPGVTRVWPFAHWLGDGNVGVFFVRDGDPDIIPSPAEVAVVAAHLANVAPLTAHLIVSAPTPITLDLAIQITPNTASQKADVVKAIKALLAVEAVPGGVLRLSHLREAISDTPGEIDHTLVSPSADIVPLQNEIVVLGEITWL